MIDNTNFFKQHRHHKNSSEDEFDFEGRKPTVKRVERHKPKYRNQIIKEYYLDQLEENKETIIH